MYPQRINKICMFAPIFFIFSILKLDRDDLFKNHIIYFHISLFDAEEVVGSSPIPPTE